MIYSYETTETKKVTKQIYDRDVYDGVDTVKALVGKKVKDFKHPDYGQRFISRAGKLTTALEDHDKSCPCYIVVPDNAYSKFLEDIKIPEGYELDGKDLYEAYRTPVPGNTVVSVYLDNTPFLAKSGDMWNMKRIIIRKIKKTERFLIGKWKIVPNGTRHKVNEISECSADLWSKDSWNCYSIVEEEVKA